MGFLQLPSHFQKWSWLQPPCKINQNLYPTLKHWLWLVSPEIPSQFQWDRYDQSFYQRILGWCRMIGSDFQYWFVMGFPGNPSHLEHDPQDWSLIGFPKHTILPSQGAWTQILAPSWEPLRSFPGNASLSSWRCESQKGLIFDNPKFHEGLLQRIFCDLTIIIYIYYVLENRDYHTIIQNILFLWVCTL